MSDKIKKRIKHIFKTEEDVRKDLVDVAKNNLKKEEKKAPTTEPIVEKKKKKKHSWARRLFYGPGMLWGGGVSKPTCPQHPNGCPPGAHDSTPSAPATSSAGGSTGGSAAGGGSGGSSGGGSA